ncbi:MAG TPA: hypothetical protein VK568_17450, partial [Thermodesulfobacteriota bacterium]|nr:hypothetical protein [Thermodesulfobacteriota bacterium]
MFMYGGRGTNLLIESNSSVGGVITQVHLSSGFLNRHIEFFLDIDKGEVILLFGAGQGTFHKQGGICLSNILPFLFILPLLL